MSGRCCRAATIASFWLQGERKVRHRGAGPEILGDSAQRDRQRHVRRAGPGRRRLPAHELDTHGYQRAAGRSRWAGPEVPDRPTPGWGWGPGQDKRLAGSGVKCFWILVPDDQSLKKPLFLPRRSAYGSEHGPGWAPKEATRLWVTTRPPSWGCTCNPSHMNDLRSNGRRSHREPQGLTQGRPGPVQHGKRCANAHRGPGLAGSWSSQTWASVDVSVPLYGTFGPVADDWRPRPRDRPLPGRGARVFGHPAA